MNIDLEDNFGDVIGKAQRGLGISDSELAKKSGASADTVRKVRDGHVDEATLRAIAPALNLDPGALVDLAQGKYKPKPIKNVDGLAQFTTDYNGMLVNAYLVWDAGSKHAIAFDTGADCNSMMKLATRENLSIEMILLTHAHPDHVADLPRLREETGAQIYAPAREPVPGAENIDEGKHFTLGKLDIEARSTWGHSPGGITFVVTGLVRPVAVVGDSMFAGSMGGGTVSYNDAVQNNLEKILTLPDDTIICPGHGPMTSVGEEKKHNPFFAHRVR
ncbi:MAG TPA: MBL fold metallo-hydrolase [Chthoniobacterales bacterium]|nr:MBL fold metallo-hydrolase [Chthoniobacterales bacterium]